MAFLTKCAECGAEVSSEAWECPKCSKYPRLRKCAICGRDMKESESRRVKDGKSTRWLHISCSEAICSQTSQCPTCHNIFSPREVRNSGSCCSKCGQGLWIKTCGQCFLPVFVDDSIKVTWSGPYKGVRDSERSSSYEAIVHKSCASQYRQRVAETHKGYSTPPQQSTCFIATAVQGTNSTEVITLQMFRDKKLLPYQIGNLFISYYEQVSPPLARYIAKSSFLKVLIRWMIVFPAFWFVKLFINPTTIDET